MVPESGGGILGGLPGNTQVDIHPASLSRVYFPPQQGGAMGLGANQRVPMVPMAPKGGLPSSAGDGAWHPVDHPYLGGETQPRGGSAGVGPPMAPPLNLGVLF